MPTGLFILQTVGFVTVELPVNSWIDSDSQEYQTPGHQVFRYRLYFFW